jgi:hypothetical protein
MEWKTEDILKVITGSGLLTLLSTIVARGMGWIRFGKADKAKVGKVEAETAIDIATVAQKRISDEVKISDAALQWNINLASQLEKANILNDKKQAENDRLHGIIDTMKRDFEVAFEKLKSEFNRRIKELEAEFEKSKNDFIKEREENREEIKRLKAEINGHRR